MKSSDFLARFQYIIWILFSFFVVLLLIDINGSQLNVFFRKTEDLFADFFNVQRYIAWNDPYHNEINGLHEKAYLPLSYLIMKVFSVSVDYRGLSLIDCWHSTSAMVSCLLYLSISVFLYFHSISLFLGKLEFRTLATICFSSVFLFSVERANLVILSSALIIYFLALKDNKNVILRFLSLFCLCVATTLKVYPVVLGLLLLKDKRFKDILLCCVLTSFMILIPFLCFKGGLENFQQLLSNVSDNSDVYASRGFFGLSSIFRLPLRALGASEQVVSYSYSICRLITILLTIASLAVSYMSKNKWSSMSLLLFVLIMYPVNSAQYCGLYMIPLIFSYIKDDTIKHNWLFVLGFVLFLNPLQIVIRGVSINGFISNAMLILIWLILIYEESSDLIKYRTCKHTHIGFPLSGSLKKK